MGDIIKTPRDGVYEIARAFLHGDVNENGKVDIVNAILILRHIVDLIDIEAV